MPPKDKFETKSTHVPNTKAVNAAVDEGRKLIASGATKIDAAMAIYRQIESEDQDTIVSAFIEGATLTPKGALTYWYTCRRRLAREKRAATQ